MMHGHEKSRSAIVAVKPTNKAERSAAEPVERRAETKGNADQQRTRRTQRRISVSKMLARIHYCNAADARHHLLEQLQPFSGHGSWNVGKASSMTSRASHADDEAIAHWI